MDVEMENIHEIITHPDEEIASFVPFPRLFCCPRLELVKILFRKYTLGMLWSSILILWIVSSAFAFQFHELKQVIGRVRDSACNNQTGILLVNTVFEFKNNKYKAANLEYTPWNCSDCNYCSLSTSDVEITLFIESIENTSGIFITNVYTFQKYENPLYIILLPWILIGIVSFVSCVYQICLVSVPD